MTNIPSSGKLFIAGKNVADMTEFGRTHMRRDAIGYIFRKFYLIPLLSAYENVKYPLILKYKKRNTTGKVTVLLEHVAIARALVNDPKILLCDEPTGNLDSRTGYQIMDILCGLHREGKTVILVTHDPKIAEYAHRTIRLVDGRVAES